MGSAFALLSPFALALPFALGTAFGGLPAGGGSVCWPFAGLSGSPAGSPWSPGRTSFGGRARSFLGGGKAGRFEAKSVWVSHVLPVVSFSVALGERFFKS